MGDFDDLAELWRQQSPAPGGAERAREIEREIRREVTRRQQNVTWRLGGLALALVTFQVIGTTSLLAPPTGPAPMTLSHFVLFHVIYAALLLYFAHRLVVGKRIQQSSGSSLRESLGLVLEATEASMRDFRVAAWADPWLFVLVPLISIAHAGVSSGRPTMSLLTPSISLIVSHGAGWVVAWRYYHNVLCRQRGHLKSLLAEIAPETG